MVEVAYNNVKNISTSFTFFELNCGYHPRVSFKKNINSRTKFKSIDKFLAKLQKVMTVCCENIYHAQKLQKRAQNKSVKTRSYSLSDKVWLSGKYIKTKWNRNLETKFFGPFWVLYLVGKQVYKLKPSKK